MVNLDNRFDFKSKWCDYDYYCVALMETKQNF